MSPNPAAPTCLPIFSSPERFSCYHRGQFLWFHSKWPTRRHPHHNRLPSASHLGSCRFALTMSGVEAISMACNVMTVISFGLETVKLCRKIQESGSSDSNLETNARRVRETSTDVERLLTAQRPASTESGIRLRRVATECIGYAKDVEKEIKYTSPRNDGLRGAIMSTFRVMRRKRRLDELQILLEASRRAMDTAVMVQIFDECIRSGDLNRSTYDTLTQDHKELLTVYEHRSRAIENLIKNVHDHITAEHAETRNIMSTRFSNLETTNADDKAYRERINPETTVALLVSQRHWMTIYRRPSLGLPRSQPWRGLCRHTTGPAKLYTQSLRDYWKPEARCEHPSGLDEVMVRN